MTNSVPFGPFFFFFFIRQQHPTGITYIPTLDSLFAVDRSGYTQFVNLTDSKCGERWCGDSARNTPKIDDRPWGDIIFEGATTKDDAHVAYVLEGGRTSTGPPKIHFFDLGTLLLVVSLLILCGHLRPLNNSYLLSSYHVRIPVHTDKWDIFHTVALPEIPVQDNLGAGSLVWIPDGHADGRFLVGSHIDGTVYAYRVSSDTSISTATLIKSFKLENVPGGDMSGMAFDFDVSKLFTMIRQDYWTCKYNMGEG